MLVLTLNSLKQMVHPKKKAVCFSLWSNIEISAQPAEVKNESSAASTCTRSVCIGMFLHVRAVSKECIGHPERSYCQSYVSAIEEVLCYTLNGLWLPRERGRWWESGKKVKQKKTTWKKVGSGEGMVGWTREEMSVHVFR